MSIEQKLLAYGDLPASEQEEVEAYVHQHPEWAPLLAEAKALYALLRATRTDSAVPDAEAVAQYVLSPMLGGRLTPEAEARRARTEAAFAEDPALERRARAMAKRLEQIAASAEDPVAQFERLTGRRLEEPAPEPAAAPPRRVAARRLLRLAVAAGVALGVLYVALALVDRLAQPDRAALAALGDLPGAYAGLRSDARGDAPAGHTAERYARALDALRSARSSTIGLFPSYDDNALDTVAVQLRAVADASGPTSWEGLEALYALGKVRFYQGKDEEAIWALQTVVALDGPSASDARRLLDYLQREEHEGAP